MTSQTKHYIELPDILAIRFECKDCGSAVSLPISPNMSFSRLSTCPNCGRSWLLIMQTSMEPVLKECAAAIQEATAKLKQHQSILEASGFKGFSLSLEIAETVDHVSRDHGV